MKRDPLSKQRSVWASRRVRAGVSSPTLPCHRPSLPQRFDEVAALYPEPPKAVHRYSGRLVAPFIEGHRSRKIVVTTFARLGGRGSGPTWSALLHRKCTCARGSAWVTSRRMGSPLYSRLGGYPRPPILMTTLLCWFLSEVNGSSLFVQRRIPGSVNVLEIAWRNCPC